MKINNTIVLKELYINHIQNKLPLNLSLISDEDRNIIKNIINKKDINSIKKIISIKSGNGFRKTKELKEGIIELFLSYLKLYWNNDLNNQNLLNITLNVEATMNKLYSSGNKVNSWLLVLFYDIKNSNFIKKPFS